MDNDIDELSGIFNTVYSYYVSDEDDTLLEEDVEDFKSMLIDTIKTFYPHLNYIINDIDNNLNISYKIDGFNFERIKKKCLTNIDFNYNFSTCEERDEFFNKNRNNPEVINFNELTEQQKKLFNQYEFLINQPQPEQKSKEWFDKRNNMITASSCGAVIGQCKYTPIKKVLLDKIGLGEKFKENLFVYHGKKYEKIAIMIYENIYNTKVGEFGLIQHTTISYLGASPDGISTTLTLDGKINKLIGRMIEIKCPPSRKICNLGLIKGDICPDYYWVQVQIQLECCDLPECDFWQCHLIEYKTEKEFFDDPVDNLIHSDNQITIQDELTEVKEEPSKVYIDRRIRKGAIIEMLPIDRSKIPDREPAEWYGKYIYPPNILMTSDEYKKWWSSTISNLNTLYPQLVKHYRYSRVVFWKLELSHNELITRQPEWFNKYRNHYAKFWDRVLYYRNHQDEAREDLIEQRLSNDVFLNTTTDRIPKTNTITKKTLSNIFISNKSDKSEKSEPENDIFVDSSESKPIAKVNNISTNIKSKPVIKTNNDIFVDSSEDIPRKQLKKTVKQKTVTKTKQETKQEAKSEIKSETKEVKEPQLLFKNQNNFSVSSIREQFKNQQLKENDDDLELVVVTENRKKKK